MDVSRWEEKTRNNAKILRISYIKALKLWDEAINKAIQKAEKQIRINKNRKIICKKLIEAEENKL